jgi:hypothetical protein
MEGIFPLMKEKEQMPKANTTKHVTFEDIQTLKQELDQKESLTAAENLFLAAHNLAQKERDAERVEDIRKHLKEICTRMQADAETALFGSVTIATDYGTGHVTELQLHKWIFILRLCAGTILECCDELEAYAEIKDWEPSEEDMKGGVL